jgi:uncharacterized Tic20 family protein
MIGMTARRTMTEYEEEFEISGDLPIDPWAVDPKLVPSDARAWGAAAQLTPLLGFSFLAPLIIWLIKRDEDPWVEESAREALNFQISIAIYAVVCLILAFVLIGIFLAIALGIFALVVSIIAGVKAAASELYRYPLTIHLVT